VGDRPVGPGESPQEGCRDSGTVLEARSGGGAAPRRSRGLPGAALWSAGLRCGVGGYQVSRRWGTVSLQAQVAEKMPLAACWELQSWGAGLAVVRVGSPGQPGEGRFSGLWLPGGRPVLARAAREGVAFTDLAAGQLHCSRSHAVRC